MKPGRQFLTIVAITLVALPLAARFLPGSHPLLEAVGLLRPMTSLGIVPQAPVDSGQGQAQGWSGGGPTPVIAAEARRLPLVDVVTTVGSARGAQSVTLAPEVSGRLLALRVTPGDRVAVGDVMAELDAEAASLAVQKARLVLEDARATRQRLERLAASGATTALQKQDAELALRTAELASQAAERDLADHRLTAPIAGVVGLIDVDVGDLVSPSTSLTRIEDRSSLIVDFRVPERAASRIAVGDRVEASLIATPSPPITGRIIAVDNAVDPASRTLRAQARIDNADDSLRPGMAFRMTLSFTGKDYPAVDPLAIQWGSDGAYLWIVRQGKAQDLPIRILQRNADSVLIDAALEPGDLVVTEGVQALRPGAEVALASGAEG